MAGKRIAKGGRQRKKPRSKRKKKLEAGTASISNDRIFTRIKSYRPAFKQSSTYTPRVELKFNEVVQDYSKTGKERKS